jgi:hypothetical protein
MTEKPHAGRKGTKDLFIREDTVKSIECGGLAADTEIDALRRPPPGLHSDSDVPGRFTRA